MGRYYTGDIEGKFWFGVQASNDASFFGGTESEPNHLDYYFDDSDSTSIANGLAQCEKKLGDNLAKLDTFFASNNGYSDEQLSKHLGVDAFTLSKLLVWYARFQLGKKIKDCVDKNGSCWFEAEL